MSLYRSATKRRAAGASLEPQAQTTSLHRSATRRRGDAAPSEQKKGYGVVQQGIKQLYPPPDSDRATDIDIVFVPGLGAHPEESWKSAKTGFNWASDKEGIARDFPNARILLYMYESAWVGPFKVKQYIRNLAHTLLEGLNAERETLGLTRPIVLIGHSMGGLVIAKAVCMAESRQELFPQMFEDIAGCALFGTPFDGADAAPVAAMLAYVGERFDKTVNSKLLEFMARGNEGLSELKEDFVRMAMKLNPRISLYGFWEEQPTTFSDLSGVPEFIRKLQIPLPKQFAQFVTKESAILSGNMESMGLAANHRDLVKFESSKDERYALVRGPLKRLIHGAHLVVKNRRQSTRHSDRELVKKVMDALDGAQVSRKRRSIKIAPSSWIPEEPEYVEWLAKFDVNIRPSFLKRGDCLWIRGPEGRGKTSASLAAVECIEEMIKTNKNTAPILLAYFFCDGVADYDTAEELLKSLVRQLIDQQESLALHAKLPLRRKGKDDSKGQFQLTVENLWQLLQDILGDVSLSGTRVYFVLNNLEALQQDSDSTKTLVDLIGLEIDNMNNGRRVMVRWLITSGQSWSIGEALKGDSVRLIDLEDEKYEDRVQSELRKHAHDKVSDLVERRKYSKALAYYAGSLIGRRAQNTQWIDITIIQLEQLPQHDSDLRVRHHLELVPQNLDELLTTAWRRVFELNRGDVDEIKEMLRVLVLTYEDPTEDELRLLTGLYSTEEERAELDKLVEKCKPLLIIQRLSKAETKVCFIQSVVKTHLLENAYKLLGLSEEDIKLQHGMLGFRAFSHIMEVFDFPATETKDEDDQTEKDNDEDQEGKDGSDEGDETDDENEGEEETDDNSENGDDEESESSSDEWESDDEESEDEDPEAPMLRDTILDLPYAVRYWLLHASNATAELAEALSTETEFWKRDSIIRRRWLTEYNRLTDDFKYYERYELSGLHIAAAIGFRQLVVALMKNGYEDEKDLRDSGYFTPLHFAAKFGQSDIIEELLNKGASIDDGVEDGYMTPLHMAAAEGNVKAMKKLLQRGASPNADCEAYGGVINAAIESGNCEAVTLLVEKNVSLVASEPRENEAKQDDTQEEDEEDDEASDDDDSDDSDDESDEDEDDEDDDDYDVIRSPLALAASRSDLTMFEFLLEKYSEKLPLAEFDTALVQAAQAGRLESFKRLFSSYKHSYEAFQDSLDQAAREKNWDIVALLLEERPDLNCDKAFLYAAKGDDEEEEIKIMEAMWEYSHGSISPQTLDAALYKATDYENEDTVQLILRFGANADATGTKYGNALTAAAYDGTIDIVTILLDHHANVNSPDGWALQTAAAEGHRDVVELLLERGADVNAFTTNERMPQGTALQAAVEACNYDLVDLLLEHGADPDRGGGELTCPIIAAASKGEKEILERLIEAKADVDVFGGPYDSAPLTYAAMYLPQSSLRLLLDAGADIDLADKDGDTALILATWYEDVESVEFLLERGANVLHRNNAGMNALQLALDKEKPACVKVLVNHVSAIMEAIRVAMESGDAAVTAVVRSVESRKQGLEYDEAHVSDKGGAEKSGRASPAETVETQSSATLFEGPGREHVSQDSGGEQQPPFSSQYSGQNMSVPAELPQHQSDSWGHTTGSSAWKPFDPSQVGPPLDEPQGFTNQVQASWKQADTPPQINDYRTSYLPQGSNYPSPPPGSSGIRRKPITSPTPGFPPQQAPMPYAQQADPSTGRMSQTYQAPSPYRPQQPSYIGGPAQYASPPGPGLQQNQYRAYQPQNQQGEDGFSSRQQTQRQSSQWPYSSSGTEPRFQ